MPDSENAVSPREFPYRQGNPWLGEARREDYEEYIAGNRAGLEALRDAVNIALESGVAEIRLPCTDYPGVVLIEGDPREAERGKPRVVDWVAGLFSFLLIPTLLIVGGLAIKMIWRWLSRHI